MERGKSQRERERETYGEGKEWEWGRGWKREKMHKIVETDSKTGKYSSYFSSQIFCWFSNTQPFLSSLQIYDYYSHLVSSILSLTHFLFLSHFLSLFLTHFLFLFLFYFLPLFASFQPETFMFSICVCLTTHHDFDWLFYKKKKAAQIKWGTGRGKVFYVVERYALSFLTDFTIQRKREIIDDFFPLIPFFSSSNFLSLSLASIEWVIFLANSYIQIHTTFLCNINP